MVYTALPESRYCAQEDFLGVPFLLLAPSTVVAPMLQILVWTSTFVSLFLYWSSIPLQQLPNVFWYKQMNHFAGLLDEPVRHPVIVLFCCMCLQQLFKSIVWILLRVSHK